MDAADSARFMRTLSVSSSSRDLGSSPVSSRIANRFSRKCSLRNSIAETLTAMVIAGRPASSPGSGLPARFAQDPCTDRQDEAAVFRDGNELRRRDRPPRGMRPAYQRFRPGNRSRPQIDLRLVVQRQFLPLQGAPQALLDGLPLDGADVHGRLEELIALAPLFLRLVHRGVGVLDQRLRIAGRRRDRRSRRCWW